MIEEVTLFELWFVATNSESLRLLVVALSLLCKDEFSALSWLCEGKPSVLKTE